jgi:hypothetical protein
MALPQQPFFKLDKPMLKVLLAIVLASGADRWISCLRDCLMKCGPASAMKATVTGLLADIGKIPFFAQFNRAPVEALIAECERALAPGS